MKIKYMLLIILVSIILVNTVSASDTIIGYGDKTFEIPEGREVSRAEIEILNKTPDAEVTFNGENYEYASELNSLDEDDFNNEYSGWWWDREWNGTNTIEFSEDIENFTLTYWINNIGGDCSSDCPIGFNVETSTLCSGSSIPVETDINCYANYDWLDIEIWIGGTMIDEDCDTDGDEGWNGACEAQIPLGMTPGTYVLRGKYKIGGDNYECVIDDSFEVTQKCSVTSDCSHAGRPSATPVKSDPYPADGSGSDSLTSEAGVYYVVPGTDIKIDSDSVVQHCSNGATGSGAPGLVAWTKSVNPNIGLEIQDSLSSCEISGKTRGDVIGPTSETIGFRPSGCDLHWNKNHAESTLVSSFDTPAKYDINIDAIYGICDSPDYICPDLWADSGWRSTLCKKGNMNTISESDGWKELREYDFVSIYPNISYTEKSRHKESGLLTIRYDVTNTGIGRVKVNNVYLSSNQFSSDCTTCSSEIEEGNSFTDAVVLNVTPSSQAEKTIQSIKPQEYSFYDLKDYSKEHYDGEKLILEYQDDLIFEYDDGYGFASQPVQTISEPISFNISFKCEDEKFAINTTDKIYYCYCNNKSFGIDVKGQNDEPFACIDYPYKGEVIVERGRDMRFYANSSFDDTAQLGELNFSWFYKLPYIGNLKEFHTDIGDKGAIFLKHFSSPGEYNIELKVKETDNIDEDYSDFILAFDKPYCLNGDTWVESAETWGESVKSSYNDCYREDSENTNYCCPSGVECVEEEDSWKCKFEENITIERCSDYNNETSCEEDRFSVGVLSVNEKLSEIVGLSGISCGGERQYNESCWEFIENCGCNWDGECNADWNYSLYCNEEKVNSGKCIFSISNIIDDCDNTKTKIIKWVANWTGLGDTPEYCLSSESMVPCATGIKLKFTTSYFIIGCLIVILGVYLFKKKNG